MQKVEIYCDESRPDLFTTEKQYDKFLLIGGLKFLSNERNSIKSAINEIRNKYKLFTEFKWKKVSFAKLEFYKELVDLFFEFGDRLRFRCIVIEVAKIDLERYHDNDAELGFYKFYYYLLNNWIIDDNYYRIFTDLKTNREKNRLLNLCTCLNNSNLFSIINSIQALPSREVDILQLADLILGLTGARLNNSLSENSAKSELVHYFESKHGNTIAPTAKDEIKYNVFKILLQNRW